MLNEDVYNNIISYCDFDTLTTLYKSSKIFENLLNKQDILDELSDKHNIIGDIANFKDIVDGYGSFLVPDVAKEMKNKPGIYYIKYYDYTKYKVVIEDEKLVSIYSNKIIKVNDFNAQNYSTEPSYIIKVSTIFVADNAILLNLKDFMYVCITDRITLFKAPTKIVNFVSLTIHPYAIDEFNNIYQFGPDAMIKVDKPLLQKIYNCGGLYEYYSADYKDNLNYLKLGIDILPNC